MTIIGGEGLVLLFSLDAIVVDKVSLIGTTLRKVNKSIFLKKFILSIKVNSVIVSVASRKMNMINLRQCSFLTGKIYNYLNPKLIF